MSPAGAATTTSAETSVAAWRARFPGLEQTVEGQPLAYLDSAATTQRPEAMLDALRDFYRRDNANPGRTLHTLARRADERLEEARRTVADFVNAGDPEEVVWTRGTTEAINLVAAAWGGANLGEGDEVVVTVAEHHSNLLPWRLAARHAGARLRLLDIDEEGRLRLDHLDELLGERTRLVAVSHVSNVLGMVNPVAEICRRAAAGGARVLVDAAQSAPHLPVDVRQLGCDFLAFSGHKIMGPMGIGVLWARRELLESMPPYQTGSNMAHDVSLDGARYDHAARRFGAGTPNVAGAVGLAAALRFLEELGREAVRVHEQELTRHLLSRLAEIEGLRVLGSPDSAGRIPLVSFALEGVPVPEIVRGLDRRGIAIRGGDLASLPLLRRLGVDEAARVSCYLYSLPEEIDRLAGALHDISARRAGQAPPGEGPCISIATT